MTSPARVEAVRSLDRITEAGAYSNVIVSKTSGLSREDHAHYQRLVYSTLRWLPYADRAIEANTKRRKLDHLVQSVLRVAIIDSAVLDTPDHAVVSEYVECARSVGSGRAAGFVNAVLRSVVGSDCVPPSAVSDSYPATVVEIAEQSLGVQAGAFLEASNEPAPVGVWQPGSDRTDLAGIRGAGYLAKGSDISTIGGDLVIDPASAAVAVSLGVEPGEAVLDLAAAPGGKTAILAHDVGEEGTVVASDVHGRRVRTARKRLPSIDWVQADARTPPFRKASFDAVLLDAPCTGLGTLRRRPEIRFRVDESAPERYGELQSELLSSAVGLVKPGGRLVYSVCTITDAETVDVIEGFGFRRPEGLSGVPHGDGLMLRPDTTGTDGMFIALLEV